MPEHDLLTTIKRGKQIDSVQIIDSAVSQIRDGPPCKARLDGGYGRQFNWLRGWCWGGHPAVDWEVISLKPILTIRATCAPGHNSTYRSWRFIQWRFKSERTPSEIEVVRYQLGDKYRQVLLLRTRTLPLLLNSLRARMAPPSHARVLFHLRLLIISAHPQIQTHIDGSGSSPV